MKKNWFENSARILVPLMALLLVFLAFAAGCGSNGNGNGNGSSDGGSDGVTGVYKLEATSDFTATLTLEDDGKGTFSITEGPGGVPITYKVEGDTVSLFAIDGSALPTGVFTITDEGLRDSTGALYKKQ